MISPIEPLEVLNQRLIDYFGRAPDNEPKWKIFWSEDLLEKRLCDTTDTGVQLLTPIVVERKKANYIKDRYILCARVEIPEVNMKELPVDKMSYEPIWTFESQSGQPLPPKWEVCFSIITTVNQNIADAGHKPKYKQDEMDLQTREAIEYRTEMLIESLFGDETKLGDSLALDSAVGYGTRKRNDWLQ